MLDINSECVEVSVRESVRGDGNKVLWINTIEGCVLRVSGIKELVIEDASDKGDKGE